MDAPMKIGASFYIRIYGIYEKLTLLTIKNHLFAIIQ